MHKECKNRGKGHVFVVHVAASVGRNGYALLWACYLIHVQCISPLNIPKKRELLALHSDIVASKAGTMQIGPGLVA